MFPLSNKSLLVKKSNIKEAELYESEIPSLKDGQLLLRIEQFAMTANNITYAAIGEFLQYWNFFPTSIEGFGIVPVWGFAKVINSNNESIANGTLLYGYLPMSQYLVVSPGKLNSVGFRDISEHRQSNAAIYNNYEFVTPEEYGHPATAYIPVIRPLFTTSFLLYHYFMDQNFQDAQRIILTSASSKTALALAFMLSSNKDEHRITICGMTSRGNKDFVIQSQFYDEVYLYSELEKLPKERTVIADFSGNKQLLADIDLHLAEHLKFISAIGLTDWENMSAELTIPKAKMFFAPTYAEVKLKEWGVAPGRQMIKQAMMDFINNISTKMEIKKFKGFEEMTKLYIAMVAGDINPSQGNIVLPD